MLSNRDSHEEISTTRRHVTTRVTPHVTTCVTPHVTTCVTPHVTTRVTPHVTTRVTPHATTILFLLLSIFIIDYCLLQSLRKPIHNTVIQPYSPEFEESLKLGDLIEFKRTWGQLNIYSHWGVYYGNGLIGHFNPLDRKRVKQKMGFEFLPAAVTLNKLKDEAGSDGILVNNKVKNHARRRTPKEIVKLIDFLTGGGGFEYSLYYFNCEHFATYIVFDGISISDQMAKLESFSAKRFWEPYWSDRLAAEAYRQWKENEASTGYLWNRAPRRFLQKYIEDNKFMQPGESS